MRRVWAIVLVSATLGFGFSACSSFGTSNQTGPSAPSSEAGDAGTGIETSSSDASSNRRSPCNQPHDLCDDFDNEAIPAKTWTESQNLGLLRASSERFVSAPNALRVEILDAGATASMTKKISVDGGSLSTITCELDLYVDGSAPLAGTGVDLFNVYIAKDSLNFVRNTLLLDDSGFRIYVHAPATPGHGVNGETNNPLGSVGATAAWHHVTFTVKASGETKILVSDVGNKTDNYDPIDVVNAEIAVGVLGSAGLWTVFFDNVFCDVTP